MSFFLEAVNLDADEFSGFYQLRLWTPPSMQTFLTSPEDFASRSAVLIAEKLKELQVTRTRDINVVFATGKTMVGVLAQLALAPGIDWNRIQAFHLDEFSGLKPDHKASFGAWLSQHLFSCVSIPTQNIHFMGSGTLSGYMAKLKRLGGADLILLGLGLDGHLAFNKSGSKFASRARRVRLAKDVVDAKAVEYPKIRRHPFANTMGLKDIMSGKNLLLLVNGAAKSGVVAKFYFCPTSSVVPATVLRRHKHVDVVLDSEAAAHINAVDIDGIQPKQIFDQLALYTQTYSGIRHERMGHDANVRVVDRLIAFFYGYAYGRLLLSKFPRHKLFLVLLGRDSRPTGPALAVAQAAGIRKAIMESGKQIEITDLGIVTTPLLESAVRCLGAHGAVMITASHNPIPQNGWKFMTANREKSGALLDAGSLLGADAKRKVIKTVQSLIGKMCEGTLDLTKFAVASDNKGSIVDSPELKDEHRFYQKVLKFYTDEIKTGAGKLDKKLVVVNDYNGGAAARVNVSVLKAMGFENVVSLGTELGICDHEIEPIGAAMTAASQALVSSGGRVGIVYDFDADRGNLVWLKPDGTAAEVSPQNVAAMNVAIELLKNAEFNRRRYPKGLAVVGHCASSGSIPRICRMFDASYFTVETGEVNVVKKMAELERRGYLVVVGVEGYSGGAVFSRSKCRDGLRTLLAMTHLLSTQKMIDAWYRRFTAERSAPDRRHVFVSKLLETLPYFISLQDKISDIVLSPREFRIALESRLKELISVSGKVMKVEGLTKSYRSILIEYSGETGFYSRSVSRAAGFGLRSRFEDGGWIARFVDIAGVVSFIWVRGSKTEIGIYKRLVDSPDEKEAHELKIVLDQLCMVGAREAKATSRIKTKPGNVLLTIPNSKNQPGWPSIDLPLRSKIVLLHAVAGEVPPPVECLVSALTARKLGNRIEWLNPNDFNSTFLSEQKPMWVIAARNSRVEEVVRLFNSTNVGQTTTILLFEPSIIRTNSFFSFTEQTLREAINAVKAHKTQVRRTRYDLSVDMLCRATLLDLRADGVATPNDHVGAYQFVASHYLSAEDAPCQAPPNLDGLSTRDRVYFVSPHPDDMEIAAGGLVSKLSEIGVPVLNLVLTLGSNGVQPTLSEQRRLLKQFGDSFAHLGELRREEVQQAASLLQKSAKGRVVCKIVCGGYEETELRQNAELEIVSLFNEDAGNGSGGRLVFFLPHPEDEHPRHRLAYEVFSEMLKKHGSKFNRNIEIFLYLSPWAGRFNAYFLSRKDQAYFKPIRDAEKESGNLRVAASRARKRGLSWLLHELIGGFGGTQNANEAEKYLAAEAFYIPE